ncbi:SRPBCC family protein [Streptomyces sp. NPDC005908]|uniref:SRPBCC family protein n=1 Tax=Streptomyces tendae TaxID=1932 RepID=A0ABX5ZT96_STRTE|nr:MULTISPECIES: SRPBCC family protein [Streptomyces]QER87806.1 SRPBCC family protein [Streptomyces tendae]TWD18639.1 polyketide cyclase/dehydrase/lipid transport protein [Streptomyces sp. T12]
MPAAATQSVEEAIEVAVPVHTAYNQWTQYKTFPRFMRWVKGVEQLRPNLTRWVIGAGWVSYEYTAEIVEQRPDELIAWRGLGRWAGHRGEVAFRSVGTEHTEIVVRMGSLPHPAKRHLLHRIPVTARVVRAELGRFKWFIEGLGQESGAWRGVIRNGQVQPLEAEPPRSRVAGWPVG